jgi:hypothetical protein
MTTGNQTINGSNITLTGNLTVLGTITGNISSSSGNSFTSIIDTSLPANGFMYTDVSGITPGLLNSTAAATNGQLLIGRTGFTPVAGTLTGTANQIVVTNGAGTITLSTPQSIATSSSPQFTALTLSGLTANSMLYSGTAGLLTTTAAPTNGQLLIGSSAAAPVLSTLTGTTHQIVVTNGAGTITLSTPQPIDVTSSVTFANITDSALTQNGHIYPGVAGLLTSTAAATNGQLLIGSTGNPPVSATLSSSTGISITNGAGSITVNNTGVTSVVAGTNINVSAATGAVTISTVGQYNTQSVTASSYAVATTDTYIGVNFAGTVSIALPSGSTLVQGKFMIIKDESGAASTNNITLNANGADRIDGQASVILAINYGSLTLLWNTNHWSII